MSLDQGPPGEPVLSAPPGASFEPPPEVSLVALLCILVRDFNTSLDYI